MKENQMSENMRNGQGSYSMDFRVFISNRLINIGVISWVVAQILKNLIDYIKHKHFSKSRLAGAGGMPSSHSAVCCSVLLTSYYQYGFSSPIFALAFILSLIVMYDAMGVRWSAGQHAKAINKIVLHLGEQEDNDELKEMIPRMNESLGHRLVEVICGALLGFFIAVMAYLLFK